MSQNTSCNECQNVIKKEGDFIHQDDKTLYGYPRYSQINADGTQTTFSYDSDEDEYNLCSNCKLDTWFEINFGDSFKEGNIPVYDSVLKEAENSFYLVSAGAFQRLDHDWIHKWMPKDGSVTYENLTNSMGVLVLAGPKSRDILSKITIWQDARPI